MVNKYYYKQKIGYDNLKYGESFEITIPSLLTLFQKAAVEHSDSIGYDLFFFRNAKTGFIITDYHVIISEMPKYQEEIEISTWTVIKKRNLLERSFELKVGGQARVVAVTKWVYLDLERRRLIKVPPEMINNYDAASATIIEGENYKIQPEWELEECINKEMIVGRKDIDTNMHVNHIKYAEWAIDEIRECDYIEKSPIELKISYKKELSRLENVKMTTYSSEKHGEYLTLMHNGQAELSAKVWSKWQ